MRRDGFGVRALAVVAVGGALGATARFGIDVAAEALGVATPWATLTVNLVGCAVMGLLVAYVLAHPGRHQLWRPFLGVGVLGGFTTFSAFAADAVVLADDAIVGAATYIVATLVGGVLALRAGVAVGEHLRQRGLT